MNGPQRKKPRLSAASATAETSHTQKENRPPVEDVKELRESKERLQQDNKVLQEQSKTLKERVETLEGKLREKENEVTQLREKYEKQSTLAAQVFVSRDICD
jgi:predicted nuclease with TOPRIM domain